MVREEDENRLLYYRTLFSQYLVDMYAKIETERLNYSRHNQAYLRADSYVHLKDALGRQDIDITQLGNRVVLPSSFTGSPRYMHERTQDAMTYVRHYGRPDLFITFTCNPQWKDIADALLPGQKPHDRHDIIARVFHLKVKAIMSLLTKGNLFGKVRCFMYSVEWQKRGLPHIHILLWLEQRISAVNIDNVICTEIPDPQKDPILYKIIKTNMIHGPCGNLRKSPCMKGGCCSKKYPRILLKETQTGDDGYPKYRRRGPADGGFTVEIHGVTLDNRWVVPYNPVLSRTFAAHINIEYLHLENGQRVYFNPKDFNNVTEKVNNPQKTTLLAFFDLCKTDNFAKTLPYVEVPSYYVWKSTKFERRKGGNNVDGWPGVKKDQALGRVYTVHPNNAECYYLRLLLHQVRRPTSFSDLKTIDGVVYPTYQSSCKSLGLLEDDKQWNATMEEAALTDSPFKLRDLFSILLIFCKVTDALSIWEKYKNSLSEDIKRQVQSECQDSVQIMNEVYNKCLISIEDTVLSLGGQCLEYYGLPQPVRREEVIQNRDYLREISYDTLLLAQVVSNNESLLNTEQYQIYNQVLDSIENGTGQVFFLDAPGGTGKTFLLKLLLARVRKNGGIALAVASSGIAATLLDGGKTAHSAFKLPLNLMRVETPLCNISKQSNMAQVLKETKLIVWDECTMVHKGGVEAFSKTLRDIRENGSLMGGVTVLLAGDFRQTLPVVPRGTGADEVRSCLKSSYLWPQIKKLALKTNMRVLLGGDATVGEFAQTVLQIGDGNYPTVDGKVIIPPTLATVVESLTELTNKIYPDIINLKAKPIDWLCERAILTPKNDRAAGINDLLLKSFEGEEIQYKSVDSVVQTDDAINYPVEFLNTLNPAGLPSHNLTLKIGAPVMLLRNLNPPKLSNGTRLQITALHRNVVEATITTGCAQGEKVFIPRIPLIPSEYPFEFKRLQFPLKVCFAITINKAQGQTLKMAGIDLMEDCFSHGQFYVACSRVSAASRLVILAHGKLTTNVVYKEVLC
ncbi:uncharacterized protein LOC135123221 [Zophobas morio]|uniref:uncharacterized protein LOC135123221 n=1 Tax=Zophobas morio TaxID=2755281 RepID=UPI003083632C